MAYGIIEFDKSGKPICEICGKAFHRVISHVRQKHGMNEREYKIQFGFDLKKGICSQQSKEISRQRVFENADICIYGNLLTGGKNSRFEKGNEGRTKEKVSEQTKNRLKEHIKTIATKEKLQRMGKQLGLSGLGNKKRWAKTNSNKNQRKEVSSDIFEKLESAFREISLNL